MLVTQSCPTLCDPWSVACQAPLSMEFSRQEYWSGLPFSSPGDLPDPGIEPGYPALQADYLSSEPPGKTLKATKKKKKTVGTGKFSKAKPRKAKNKQVGLYQAKILFHSKGNHQQNEKTSYQMGENMCK